MCYSTTFKFKLVLMFKQVAQNSPTVQYSNPVKYRFVVSILCMKEIKLIASQVQYKFMSMTKLHFLVAYIGPTQLSHTV